MAASWRARVQSPVRRSRVARARWIAARRRRVVRLERVERAFRGVDLAELDHRLHRGQRGAGIGRVVRVRGAEEAERRRGVAGRHRLLAAADQQRRVVGIECGRAVQQGGGAIGAAELALHGRGLDQGEHGTRGMVGGGLQVVRERGLAVAGTALDRAELEPVPEIVAVAPDAGAHDVARLAEQAHRPQLGGELEIGARVGGVAGARLAQEGERALPVGAQPRQPRKAEQRLDMAGPKRQRALERVAGLGHAVQRAAFRADRDQRLGVVGGEGVCRLGLRQGRAPVAAQAGAVAEPHQRLGAVGGQPGGLAALRLGLVERARRAQVGRELQMRPGVVGEQAHRLAPHGDRARDVARDAGAADEAQQRLHVLRVDRERAVVERARAAGLAEGQQVGADLDPGPDVRLGAIGRLEMRQRRAVVALRARAGAEAQQHLDVVGRDRRGLFVVTAGARGLAERQQVAADLDQRPDIGVGGGPPRRLVMSEARPVVAARAGAAAEPEQRLDVGRVDRGRVLVGLARARGVAQREQVGAPLDRAPDAVGIGRAHRPRTRPGSPPGRRARGRSGRARTARRPGPARSRARARRPRARPRGRPRRAARRRWAIAAQTSSAGGGGVAAASQASRPARASALPGDSASACAKASRAGAISRSARRSRPVSIRAQTPAGSIARTASCRARLPRWSPSARAQRARPSSAWVLRGSRGGGLPEGVAGAFHRTERQQVNADLDRDPDAVGLDRERRLVDGQGRGGVRRRAGAAGEAEQRVHVVGGERAGLLVDAACLRRIAQRQHVGADLDQRPGRVWMGSERLGVVRQAAVPVAARPGAAPEACQRVEIARRGVERLAIHRLGGSDVAECQVIGGGLEAGAGIARREGCGGEMGHERRRAIVAGALQPAARRMDRGEIGCQRLGGADRIRRLVELAEGDVIMRLFEMRPGMAGLVRRQLAPEGERGRMSTLAARRLGGGRQLRDIDRLAWPVVDAVHALPVRLVLNAAPMLPRNPPAMQLLPSTTSGRDGARDGSGRNGCSWRPLWRRGSGHHGAEGAAEREGGGGEGQGGAGGGLGELTKVGRAVHGGSPVRRVHETTARRAPLSVSAEAVTARARPVATLAIEAMSKERRMVFFLSGGAGCSAAGGRASSVPGRATHLMH